MKQFDVYVNPSKDTRHAYPYILDIQSPAIAAISTRLVVPLGRADSFSGQVLTGLTPAVSYGDQDLLILVPQIASVPSKILQDPIGSLSHMRDEIVAAIDFAITGI